MFDIPLAAFRGSAPQIPPVLPSIVLMGFVGELPVLAVISTDTASFGNIFADTASFGNIFDTASIGSILGFCSGDILPVIGSTSAVVIVLSLIHI